MSKCDYDIIVIGGGIAGLAAASMTSGVGKRTLLVEKERLGGNCSLHTCMPTKSLIRSGIIRDILLCGEKWGLTYTISDVKTHNVFPYVQKVIADIASIDTAESLQTLGIEVLFGSPKFINKNQISLNGKSISSDKFIIATGSRPSPIEIEGSKEVTCYNNETIFTLKELPRSIIVIGGGPAGIEFALAFRLLGLAVTVVELADTVLLREDREMTKRLADYLVGRGIKILTGYKILKMWRSENQTHLEIQNRQGDKLTIKSEAVLTTIGRHPNIESLDLEKAGVAYDHRGIKVDRKQKTTAGNIYACGDITGIFQMGATSERQALVAANNAAIPFLKHTVNYTDLAWITFTEPPFAHIGLTEEEARVKYGNHLRIYRYEYANIRRAKMERDSFGMAKVICTWNFKLIGAHIIGDRAEELSHELQVFKALGKPTHRLHFILHAYPTYAEGLLKRIGDIAYLDWLSSSLFIKIGLKLMPGLRNNMQAIKSKL